MIEFPLLKKTSSLVLVLMIAAGLLFPVSGLAGETVTLKNGKVLQGTIAALSGNRTMIYFQPDDRSQEPRWISLSEIRRIQFGAVVADLRPSAKPAGVKQAAEPAPDTQKPAA